MKYKFIRFLIFFITILIIIVIPFAVERMLLNVDTFPFSISITFSREAWFSFIASYLGAIGIIILGIIAMWQNKRYKELSDKSSQESTLIQQELKNLSKKTMKAIETLKRIELAKYYPSIEKMPYTCHGISKKRFIKEFQNEDYTIQSNLCNFKDHNDLILPISELVDKYNTYLFIVKNVGEKSIRNFNCKRLLINGKHPSFTVYNECDIASSKYAIIAILNFPEFKKNEVIELNMKFVFKNLVMDDYYIETEIVVYCEEDCIFSNITNFTFPQLYEGNK